MLIMSIYRNPFNDNEKDCDDLYDEKRAWVWIVGVNWGDGNLTDQMDLRWSSEVPSDNISQSDKDYHLDHHHHHDDDQWSLIIYFFMKIMKTTHKPTDVINIYVDVFADMYICVFVCITVIHIVCIPVYICMYVCICVIHIVCCACWGHSSADERNPSSNARGTSSSLHPLHCPNLPPSIACFYTNCPGMQCIAMQ